MEMKSQLHPHLPRPPFLCVGVVGVEEDSQGGERGVWGRGTGRRGDGERDWLPRSRPRAPAPIQSAARATVTSDLLQPPHPPDTAASFSKQKRLEGRFSRASAVLQPPITHLPKVILSLCGETRVERPSRHKVPPPAVLNRRAQQFNKVPRSARRSSEVAASP